jgi:hypothetical protein
MIPLLLLLGGTLRLGRYGNKRCLKPSYITHLNEGIGCPWAGHCKARAIPSCHSKRASLSFEANLGALPDMGSGKEANRTWETLDG